MGLRVWKATTRVHPSLSKCDRISAGVSGDLSTQKASPENTAGSLTSQIDEVVVLQPADSLELTTDVELAGGVEEVLDGRVSLVIVTENLSSLKSPENCIVSGVIQKNFQTLKIRKFRVTGWDSLVGLVDVLNCQDSQVAVIPEVPQCDLLAGRKA